MQLMTTEPHKSRHQILGAQSFYLSDNTLRQNINYTSAEYLESPLLHQGPVQANYSTFVPPSPASEITNQNTATSPVISPKIIKAESIPSETDFDSRSTTSHTSASYQQDSPIASDVVGPVHALTHRNNINREFDNNTIPNNSISVSNNLNMNIQPTGFTKNHLLNNSSLQASDELSIKKRREDLSRRPSYRKIFNDLTGLSGPMESTPVPNPHIIPNPGPLAPPAAPHRQSPQQDPSIARQSPVSVDLQTSHHHIQTPNHHQQQQQQQQQPHHHHQQPPPPIHHHHHQQPPPPIHHPQASQLHQVHQMLNTATSPPITGKVVVGEEVNKKRELRLQKNREAAKECRRKKKEYIKCLENRVAVLENQNKALIDELKTLKDLYCKTTND
uniref:Cyclic AMP-responsive element-binding protein 1 n=1 Tax=Aceria tosichella TaxID=561515 RepID=A0A6G1S3Z4_9ACAR